MPGRSTSSRTWAYEPTRALDGAILFATCCAVGLFIILLSVRGAEYFETDVLPWLLGPSLVLIGGVIASGFLYALPRLRPTLLLFLGPASILLGFTGWTYAFTLTARFAGPAGLAVGFSLAGVGVFPIGLAAALLSREFLEAAIMVVVTLTAMGARMLGEKCGEGTTN